MKTTSYSRFTIWLCSLVMTAFGFASCGDDEDTVVPDEYGAPYADYKYMGTVTDQDGNPIEGIKATLVGYNSLASSQMVAEFTTDKNGKFESEYYSETLATVKLIELKDVDGEKNGGEFAAQNITISQMQTTKVKDGDGKWYMGIFDRKADVTLGPKEADKEEME